MVKGGRVLTAMVVVMLAASPAAFAKGKEHDPQKHLDSLTKKLELTDQQRSQVEQITNDYRSRMESLRSQMDALHKEKREKISAVLTPEQREKFEKMKQHKGQRRWFHKRES